jgi:hypothetical protein
VTAGKGQFLHIAFKWSAAPKTTELEATFNQAVDWLRYTPNCWIVWTTSSAQKWFERLKPHLGASDHMFICRLDVTERNGWLPKWLWEWLGKQR